MVKPMGSTLPEEMTPVSVPLDDLPILYEDDEEADMGESNPHGIAVDIVWYGLKAHLVGRPQLQVFSNLNLYYHRSAPICYVSPDIMVVSPVRVFGNNVTSYRIGTDGPAPFLVVEVLSERSAQERDLDSKLSIYGDLHIPEYILADVTGQFLQERLLLKRLQPDQAWGDEQDPDGGVTSRLGFRLIIEDDGQLRVVDTATGRRYVRPEEAEERIRELEAELARLKQKNSEQQKNP